MQRCYAQRSVISQTDSSRRTMIGGMKAWQEDRGPALIEEHLHDGVHPGDVVRSMLL